MQHLLSLASLPTEDRCNIFSYLYKLSDIDKLLGRVKETFDSPLKETLLSEIYNSVTYVDLTNGEPLIKDYDLNPSHPKSGPHTERLSDFPSLKEYKVVYHVREIEEIRTILSDARVRYLGLVFARHLDIAGFYDLFIP